MTLTPREAAALALLGPGRAADEIADRLGLTLAAAVALLLRADAKARALVGGTVAGEK